MWTFCPPDILSPRHFVPHRAGFSRARNFVDLLDSLQNCNSPLIIPLPYQFYQFCPSIAPPIEITRFLAALFIASFDFFSELLTLNDL